MLVQHDYCLLLIQYENMRMNKNVRALVIITILLLNLFSCETNSQPHMDYSQFQLVYSYEYHQTGDKKYHKIIKYLASRYRVSLSENLSIYFYDGYYYIFRWYPVTDKRKAPPITISKDRAEEIMATTP